jgi:hypothetical protein
LALYVFLFFLKKCCEFFPLVFYFF